MSELNHGINVYKNSTEFPARVNAEVSVPFFIGAWPCHTAGGYSANPTLIKSFEAAKREGGYSDEWRDTSGNPKWSLCQAAYSHFKLFGAAPAVFCNVFDPATHKSAVAAADKTVTDHCISLPFDALDTAALVIKTTGESPETLVKDSDYTTYYTDDALMIELDSESDHYDAESLNVAYDKADLSAITAATIEEAVEKIEECNARIGIVPDLICAPGWSQTPAVAQVMAAKAPAVNGLFHAKAVVDIDSGTSGADAYDEVKTFKDANGYTDENMIVCWPLIKVGEYVFDYSVYLCGVMAVLDASNGGVPYESPSNKTINITGCVNKAGTEINLTPAQGDEVSYTSGVVTAINFSGWRVWGNYTGCKTAGETDVAKIYICTNRMMDYICNTFVRNYWSYVDRPLTRVLIDAIVNSFNTWLNGLTHDGKLYGGEIQYVEDNNPLSELIGGKFRLDAAVASPVPAQRIDMFVEYDVDILVEALTAVTGG